MQWSDIAGVVGKAAPVLGTILGGPAGGAIGGLVAAALGTDPTPDAVAAAIANDPDAAVKLREIETTHEQKLQELALDGERAYLADVANAREREIKTGDKATPRALAVFITAGFFGALFWLLIEGKPEQGGDALMLMLGSLQAAWTGVVAYFFGSTKGSAEKTALLAKLKSQ